MTTIQKSLASVVLALTASAGPAGAADATGEAQVDMAAVSAIDTAYQAAVERDDDLAMAQILHPDFILVVGRGTVITREQLLETTRNRDFSYEKQVEVPGTQTVRLYGKDTAIVTALLWLKGTQNDKKTGAKTPFDKKLWFSDTYVRTADGWKYAFGQASIALPPG
jgi:ketosteroid isomerase-like protein